MGHPGHDSVNIPIRKMTHLVSSLKMTLSSMPSCLLICNMGTVPMHFGKNVGTSSNSWVPGIIMKLRSSEICHGQIFRNNHVNVANYKK